MLDMISTPLRSGEKFVGMTAGVAHVRAAHREEIAVRIQRQLRFDHEVARLIVGGERFVSLARPLHRTSDAACGPHDERELAVEHAARAEMAADVARDDAHGILGYAEHDRDVHLRAPGAARSGVKRVQPARFVVLADRCARFQRHAGHARDRCFEARDVRGARERSRRRITVAGIGIEADVGTGVVEQTRRSGSRRRPYSR